MRAAIVTRPGNVQVREVSLPRLGEESDVLVRTVVSSICGSDLHEIFGASSSALQEPWPGYPGHESVGVVVESRTSRFRFGDRVLVAPDLAHAACFAEYQAVPSRFLIKLVDPDISSSSLVLAQQIGTTIFAMKRFWAGQGRGAAVIIGAGSAGLSFVALCRRAGFDQIIVCDPHPHRLGAATLLGATSVIEEPTLVVEAVQKLTNGVGAELVIEAAGRDAARLQAFQCVKLEGRIGLFGLPESERFSVPYAELFRRRPIITMRWNAQGEYGSRSFRQAIRLISNGGIDAEAFSLREYPIEDIDAALASAREPSDGAVKVAVRFP